MNSLRRKIQALKCKAVKAVTYRILGNSNKNHANSSRYFYLVQPKDKCYSIKVVAFLYRSNNNLAVFLEFLRSIFTKAYASIS